MTYLNLSSLIFLKGLYVLFGPHQSQHLVKLSFFESTSPGKKKIPATNTSI